MTLDVIPQNALYVPESLEDFIKHLRRFSRQTIVHSGKNLLWDSFRNQDFKKRYSKKIPLLQAYGPRIIMLALARATQWRNLSCDKDDFFNLCAAYLHIPTSISDPEFLNTEADAIISILERDASSDQNIASNFLDPEAVSSACRGAFISRGVAMQHQAFNAGIEEFFRDALIIKMIDERTSGQASYVIEQKFGISLMQLLRAVWSLLVLGLAGVNDGEIDLNQHKFLADLVDRLKINVEICCSVAGIISFKESEIGAQWLDAKVLKEHNYYQPFYPDPLFNTPIIKLDQNKITDKYLIPSPVIFLRGFRQSVFSLIYKEAARRGEMGAAIGDAIEEQIFSVLKFIFGQDCVSRLSGEGKHADFVISLDTVTLVIEVKTSVASIAERSVMNASHVAKMWNRLHSHAGNALTLWQICLLTMEN